MHDGIGDKLTGDQSNRVHKVHESVLDEVLGDKGAGLRGTQWTGEKSGLMGPAEAAAHGTAPEARHGGDAADKGGI
jgi:hypothetical protein